MLSCSRRLSLRYADLSLPMTLGCLWGIFCTDLVQDLEYQVRPYEVRPGQTAAVVQECVEYLYQVARTG